MMKRIVSVILCLVITLSCLSSLAETTDTSIKTFNAKITAAMNKNAKTWMQNEENRGYFTVCILMDYILTREDGEEPPFELGLFDHTTYVGRDGFNVVLVVLSDDFKQMMVLLYNTQAEEAGWAVSQCAGKSAVEAALEATCSDGYYKNDVVDLYSVYQDVMDILNQE